jgi:hypothetical protein
MSPAFVQSYLQLSSTWAQVPVLLFGLGAILLAQNPEGTVHQQAMGFQKLLHRLSGARAVPAATGYAGRHDPRLTAEEPTPQAEEKTAEVTKS